MIKYKKGYKYQLAETYLTKTDITPADDARLEGWIILRTDGTLIINKGYAWDGASGPAIDTKTIMRGSLIHDALYQLMRECLLSSDWFAAANNELHKACINDGMHWLRAWYVYRGVSLFGKQFAEPKLAETITAP